MDSINSKKNPILSIGIVTYNRSKLLELNIKNLLAIKNKNKLNIEVLVLNNGSRDSTKNILNKFAKDIKIRNVEYNLGINPAISLIISEIKGTFLWLLGDDDFIYKEVFLIIYRLICSDKRKLKSIFLPSKPFDNLDQLKFLNKKIKLEDYNFSSNQFLSSLLIRKSGFISAHIFPSSVYKKNFHYGLNLIGNRNNYLVKYVAILTHIKCRDINYLKSPAFLECRIKNNRSHFLKESISNRFQTFFLDNHRVVWHLTNNKYIKNFEKFKLFLYASTTLGSGKILFEYLLKIFFTKRFFYVSKIPLFMLINLCIFFKTYIFKIFKNK